MQRSCEPGDYLIQGKASETSIWFFISRFLIVGGGACRCKPRSCSELAPQTSNVELVRKKTSCSLVYSSLCTLRLALIPVGSRLLEGVLQRYLFRAPRRGDVDILSIGAIPCAVSSPSQANTNAHHYSSGWGYVKLLPPSTPSHGIRATFECKAVD